jgi:hypothetical protein
LVTTAVAPARAEPRDAILAAAREAFSRHACTDASLRGIAREAHVDVQDEKMPMTIAVRSSDRLSDPTASRTLHLTISLVVLGVFVTYVPITSVSVALTTIGRSTGGNSTLVPHLTSASPKPATP